MLDAYIPLHRTLAPSCTHAVYYCIDPDSDVIYQHTNGNDPFIPQALLNENPVRV